MWNSEFFSLRLSFLIQAFQYKNNVDIVWAWMHAFSECPEIWLTSHLDISGLKPCRASRSTLAFKWLLSVEAWSWEWKDCPNNCSVVLLNGAVVRKRLICLMQTGKHECAIMSVLNNKLCEFRVNLTTNLYWPSVKAQLVLCVGACCGWQINDHWIVF